jgi:hypothetical protein
MFSDSIDYFNLPGGGSFSLLVYSLPSSGVCVDLLVESMAFQFAILAIPAILAISIPHPPGLN